LNLTTKVKENDMARIVNHFARAKMMFAAIATVMLLPSPVAQRDALDAIGEYRSRGHGGKHRPKGRFLGWLYPKTSKYVPHQGKKECARRRYQAARDEARREEKEIHSGLGNGRFC
jgi:hypothetical protein